MGLSGQKIEVTPPAEVPEEMPLPSDPKAIFLGGLFFLALMAAAYVAREVILPLVFAIVLSLLLQPALRLLERLRLPRTLASLLLILALLGTIVGLESHQIATLMSAFGGNVLQNYFEGLLAKH
jgi:predicted PurR-regulated permease PerM